MFGKSPYKNSFFFLTFLFFFSSLLFSQSGARENFLKAQDLFQKFRYYEASGLLQKALLENPYYTEAQILLGDSYFAMGNNSAAWETYLQAEKRDPNNPDLLVKLAKTKLAIAQSREDALAAEYYLKKAYRLAPRNTSVFVAYGEFYMKINDYQKALDYYSSLGNVLDNAQIFLNRAKIYEAWGKYDQAMNELKQAESLDGKNYRILLALGKLFAKTGRYNEALTYINSAYSYNPKNSEILEALADIYIQQNNFEQASRNITQLITNDPSNPVLYYSLALCYESLGAFDKAISVLEEGLKQDYSNEFLRIKAESLAVEKLSLSSPVRKKFAEFYTSLAKDSQRRNSETQTLFFLKRALELVPLDVGTRMKIAYIYRGKSYLYEYLRLLQGGIFLDPSNTNFQDQLRLNQKFILNSLSYKENIPSEISVPLEPVLQIGDTMIQDDSYLSFDRPAKKLLLSAILNKHSLNAFIKGEESPGDPKPQFNIQFTMIPTRDSLSMKVQVTYIPTGATYKTYNFTEHGNNRMIQAFLRLANNLENDIPKIGRILKIDGNNAIVNIGAQQGLQLGQPIKILNGTDLPNKIFSTKTVDPSWEIAEGKVVELGENISKIFFRPLDYLVFNMVQQNQSIVLQESPKKSS